MKALFILFFFFIQISTQPKNPSVIVRLNRQGWDFLKDTVLDLMKRLIPTLKIPAGQTWEMGHVKVTVKGGIIDGINTPILNYTLDNHQMTITMNRLYLTAKVWFKAKAHYIFPITTSGWIGLRINNVNAIGSVNVSLIDERPHLVLNNCANSVQSVLVTPHCRNAWAYRPFLGIAEDAAKKMLKKSICTYLRMGINQINTQLSTIPLQFSLGSNFTLDYSFETIKFDPNYSETAISGTVLYGNERCLIEPSEMDKGPLPQTMGQVWVSEQIVNCIFRSAHQGAIIQYTITKDVQGAAPYLRTHCPFKASNAVCMGTFWPQLDEKYPKEYIDVHMHSFEEPNLKLSMGNARFRGSVLLDFYLNPMATTKDSLVTMKITSESSVVIKVDGTRLNGYLKDTTAEIEQIHSTIGDIEPGSITSFRNLFVSVEEILLNGLLRQGIPIPIFKEAAMALAGNSTINLLNDFVRIDANFIHQPIKKTD
ncbi:unnamed protein product, partial [Mesorhabditis belari]|uniref:Lipid-binding serum glycoprotein C-terminal domain-containing protein n=1 Tax=Mesorhabditis belari TaxID=2138241 RepID=A0AAF3J1U1_9BILA